MIRGVARNLLWGTKEGVLGTESPSCVQGHSHHHQHHHHHHYCTVVLSVIVYGYSVFRLTVAL